MKTQYLIGNAHIDPVWLWQWREGYHEVKATFRSALDRMNETDEFVFTCACACYYRWVEENDPAMFEEIRARVREGRWSIVGGIWIQPDMNTPSGESLVRQLLISQRYFFEKFGLTVTTGYNVDSFGHNAQTPQLLKKAGIEHYVWMRPSVVENPEIPEGPMVWESPDGSRVTAYRIFGEYTRLFGVTEKIEDLFAFSEKIGQPVLCFYGVGNHGGGPTIENLREINAYRAEGARGDDITYACPDDYFRELAASGRKIPHWSSELQHHASGCYSTHSQSKRLHRAAENALLRMEKLGVLSYRLTGHKQKAVFVRQAWENLLFNEFHDIMGGCSLPEGLEDAVVQLNETLSIADREENAALQRMSWQVDTSKGLPPIRSKEENQSLWGIRGLGTPVVVFNPHAFEATGHVLIRCPIRTVRDDEGNSIPCQIVRASRTNNTDSWDGLFNATVPALGYRLYWVFLEETGAMETTLSVSKTCLENKHIRAEFDPVTGDLCALIHKETGYNALSGPTRAVLMDISHCDTWAHNIFKFDREAGVFTGAEVKVTEDGPVRACLQVTARYGRSTLVQTYSLYAEADQLEIDTRVDMQETHRMLKLCYPTAGKTDVAEIPYGVLERRGNGDEEHCQRWVALQGEDGGLALLNDGKYSYSAADGELRMTVCNTSIYADHYGQEYRDDSCRFMDMGEQRFTTVLLPYPGNWREAGLNHRAACLNQSLPYVAETYHTGPLGGSYCGISVDSPAVEVGAFKRSEDEKGFILRLAETTGRPEAVTVDVKLIHCTLNLSFGPYEIKTLYLPEDGGPAHEVLLTEL